MLSGVGEIARADAAASAKDLSPLFLPSFRLDRSTQYVVPLANAIIDIVGR